CPWLGVAGCRRSPRTIAQMPRRRRVRCRADPGRSRPARLAPVRCRGRRGEIATTISGFAFRLWWQLKTYAGNTGMLALANSIAVARLVAAISPCGYQVSPQERTAPHLRGADWRYFLEKSGISSFMSPDSDVSGIAADAFGALPTTAKTGVCTQPTR